MGAGALIRPKVQIQVYLSAIGQNLKRLVIAVYLGDRPPVVPPLEIRMDPSPKQPPLAEFLGVPLHEETPDHSSLSMRRLLGNRMSLSHLRWLEMNVQECVD